MITKSDASTNVWREVVLASLASGSTPEEAIDAADLVHGHFKNRFTEDVSSLPITLHVRTLLQFTGQAIGARVVYMCLSGNYSKGIVKDYAEHTGKVTVDNVLIKWDDEYVGDGDEPEEWVDIDRCRVLRQLTDEG